MVDAEQENHVVEDQAGLFLLKKRLALSLAVIQSAYVRVKVDGGDAADKLDYVVDHSDATEETVTTVLDLGKVFWFEVEGPRLDWLGDFELLFFSFALWFDLLIVFSHLLLI